MGVSKNKGTPKWMVYNGKPYYIGWFGGTTIFGNIHMKKIIDPYIKALGLKKIDAFLSDFGLGSNFQLPSAGCIWRNSDGLEDQSFVSNKCLVCMNYDTFLWVFGGESLESLRRFFLDRKNHPCFLTGSFTSPRVQWYPLGRRSSMLMEIRNPKEPPTTGWDVTKNLVKNLGISTNKTVPWSLVWLSLTHQESSL